MLTLREAVSLLRANGHAHASAYPITRIFLEADIVRRRLNRERADAAMLMQLCVGSLLDRQTGQDFSKRIKEMTGGG